jgi:hypothetical protein
MNTVLYNLHTDGDNWRITKFVDGNVESSYLCSETECECPAGSRPSCRHRQMLPSMLAHGLCNTHWFWHFDLHAPVDMGGTPKRTIEAVAEGHALRTPEPEYLEGLSQSVAQVTIISPGDPYTSKPALPKVMSMSAPPWRRL